MLLFKIESKSNLYVFIFLFLTLDSAQRYALPSPIGHIHTFIYVLAIPLHIYIEKCVCEQKWLFYLKKYFFIFYTRLRSTICSTLPLRAYSYIYICARHSFTYIYKEMRMRAKMIILFKKIFFLFFTLDSAQRYALPSPKGHIHTFIYVLAIPLHIYI